MAHISPIAPVDIITPTIFFDVIKLETREVITSNGQPDSPSFDFIEFPTGLGFQQEVSVVEGDTIDYILKQSFKKKNITLTLSFNGENSNVKAKIFVDWISKYINLDNYRIRFSYSVNGVRRYVEVAAINYELQESDGRWVTAQLTLQPLTPWYEEGTTKITITESNSSGKIYPYSYPYSYGGGAYAGDNNVISNGYLKDMPIKIEFHGPYTAPFVGLRRITTKSDGSIEVEPSNYAEVRTVEGTNIAKNEVLVIDGLSNRIYKKTINEDTGVTTTQDMFNAIDKNYNSFLFAENGQSRVVIAEGAAAGAYTQLSFTRYVL